MHSPKSPLGVNAKRPTANDASQKKPQASSKVAAGDANKVSYSPGIDAKVAAIEGAIVGGIIGSLLHFIGIGSGAFLGAVIGICISAGLFAGLTTKIVLLLTKIQIQLGLYSFQKEMQNESNPEDYQLSETDKERIQDEIQYDLDLSTLKEISIRIEAIYRQRKIIGVAKFIPGTIAAKEDEALKILLLEGVKTGKALSSHAYTVGEYHFAWNGRICRYIQVEAGAASEPLRVMKTASLA